MAHKAELLGYQGATGEFFDTLQELYGIRLEALNVDEKLLLLTGLFAYHLNSTGETMEDVWKPDSNSPRSIEIFGILKGLEEFEPFRQFAFAEALLNQVKSSYRLHQQFLKQLTKAGVEEALAAQVAAILASGGDRTEAECELVSEVWAQVSQVDERLAKRIEQAMGQE
ncbi:hypothetical protein H6G00_00565 [Leptolyngbya sp. FACHB-541]|uniref:hypothetical protein n=1 Tax=Leptolyngbya sp. FACHB-541 TaxID=2692810 RepID=UPI001689F253|nr:hypothetical protein [Leptolyngbya sp. FACHB-541]MBD1995121.1 hypothetical protein [Leptolyngbya sp. FACHB-541]